MDSPVPSKLLKSKRRQRRIEKLWVAFRVIRSYHQDHFHENLESNLFNRFKKLKQIQGSHRIIAEQTGLPSAMVSLVIGEMLKREKKEKK